MHALEKMRIRRRHLSTVSLQWVARTPGDASQGLDLTTRANGTSPAARPRMRLTLGLWPLAFAVVACGNAKSPANGLTPPPTTMPGTSDGGEGAPDLGSGVMPGHDAGVADAAPPPPPPDMAQLTPTLRVVAYLPNYSGSYAAWAKSIDFHKMTHLNLAFATATTSNGWDLGAADGDVKALVDAAHAAGVKVIASLGGGGGDQSVIARFKDAANVPPLVASLDQLVAAHNLDGVDLDIEDGNHLGADYSTFVSAIIATLRPERKLVTAAVAQYLQGSMSDATLHSFDFVNVMIYSNYNDSVSAMSYYANDKAVPKQRITLGAGFFGTDRSSNEYAYKDIIAADGSAWSKDQATVNNNVVNYTGMASMKKLAEYSRGFGGIMFWELSEDTTDAHSLYKVIQAAM
jgi:hypothetical protein